MRRRKSVSYRNFRWALIAGAVAITIFSSWRGTSTPQVVTAPRAPWEVAEIYGPFAMVKNNHLVITRQRTFQVGGIKQTAMEVRLP